MDMETALTATTMQPYVGQTVNVQFESVVVPCRILDVKMAWGKSKFSIQPINGSGSQWVESGRIKFADKL